MQRIKQPSLKSASSCKNMKGTRNQRIKVRIISANQKSRTSAHNSLLVLQPRHNIFNQQPKTSQIKLTFELGVQYEHFRGRKEKKYSNLDINLAHDILGRNSVIVIMYSQAFRIIHPWSRGTALILTSTTKNETSLVKEKKIKEKSAERLM